MNEIDSLLQRIARRKERVLGWFEKIERRAVQGAYGGEAGRQFLDRFAQGSSINACCGDFAIGDAVGIDLDPNVVGADLLVGGDSLPFDRTQVDSLVTNYFEAFANPRQTLREWNRVLRAGGVVAIVCRDSDAYTDEDPLGPLVNKKRFHCFNERILTWHLRVAGFEVFETEREGQELRVAARKVKDA